MTMRKYDWSMIGFLQGYLEMKRSLNDINVGWSPCSFRTVCSINTVWDGRLY